MVRGGFAGFPILCSLFAVLAYSSTARADEPAARTAHVSFEVPSESFALYELRRVEEVREGWGKVRRVSVEKFERLCYSPCEVSLAAGTHTFAVATKEGDPVGGPPVALAEGSHRLMVEYTDNSGTRSAGTGLAMTGALVASLSSYGSFHQAGEDRSTPGLAIAGVVIGAIITIGGIVMSFTPDTVEFRVNPESDGDGRWSSVERRSTARAESGFGPF
jgi:hypothetical protein